MDIEKNKIKIYIGGVIPLIISSYLFGPNPNRTINCQEMYRANYMYLRLARLRNKSCHGLAILTYIQFYDEHLFQYLRASPWYLVPYITEPSCLVPHNTILLGNEWDTK